MKKLKTTLLALLTVSFMSTQTALATEEHAAGFCGGFVVGSVATGTGIGVGAQAALGAYTGLVAAFSALGGGCVLGTVCCIICAAPAASKPNQNPPADAKPTSTCAAPGPSENMTRGEKISVASPSQSASNEKVLPADPSPREELPSHMQAAAAI